MPVRILTCCVIGLVLGCQPSGRNPHRFPGQYHEQFSQEITRKVGYKYLVFLPDGYKKAADPWPMILFLHGADLRGDDLERVKLHGPPKRADQEPGFPFVVVAPQCPKEQYWDSETLNTLLDDVFSKYDAIDPDRVYLTGLSMGGFGTWSLAISYPDRFAAIAPICGGGTRLGIHRIKHLPVWVFHGAKDDLVLLREAQVMVDALKKRGGNPKFTIYPDAGHVCWPRVYDHGELYDWFLQHRRQPCPQ